MTVQELREQIEQQHDGLNVDLLLKVAQRLLRLKHQKLYNQAAHVEQTECGTACCIAAWTLIESGLSAGQLLELDKMGGLIHSLAARRLGLTHKQALNLFDGGACGWPDEYEKRFDDANDGISDERPSRVASDLLTAIAKGTVIG